jgi:ATP-dependent DNA helicase RecG
LYLSSFSQIELKREVNADFKKEVIAFANTAGGEIFVGIEKKGRITGIANTDEVMYTQITLTIN